MQISFKGNFKGLEDFAEKIATAPDVLVQVNKQLAEESIEMVREGFEKSTDPYSKPWADLKLREGRPLEDKGGLKSSWFVKSYTHHNFRIANAKAYAIFHQRGTGIYGPHQARIKPTTKKALRLPNGMLRSSVAGAPKRRMVPESGRLPARWRARYIEVAREVLTEHFR